MTWICLNMLHILRVTLLVIHRLSWQLHCIQWMLQFPWMLYLTILSVKQYVHPYLLNFRLQKVSVYWVEALNSLHFQIDNTHIIVETFLRHSVNRQVSALFVHPAMPEPLTHLDECFTCKAVGGEEKKLLVCLCHAAAYCGKECQVAWVYFLPNAPGGGRILRNFGKS